MILSHLALSSTFAAEKGKSVSSSNTLHDSLAKQMNTTVNTSNSPSTSKIDPLSNVNPLLGKPTNIHKNYYNDLENELNGNPILDPIATTRIDQALAMVGFQNQEPSEFV
ncbi:MAG: hypothetical protein ABL917_04255 [Parcubacteria group bacterium]